MVDSRNEVFVEPTIGNQVEKFSVRISFLKPSDSGALFLMNLFFTQEGMQLKL